MGGLDLVHFREYGPLILAYMCMVTHQHFTSFSLQKRKEEQKKKEDNKDSEEEKTGMNKEKDDSESENKQVKRGDNRPFL